MRDMECTAISIISLTNDMLSYLKEGPDHMYNTVAVLRKTHGYPVQQAFDAVGAMVEELFEKWDTLEATLPSWGAENDRQVQLYLDGVKGHVIANANWRRVCSSGQH